MLALIVDDDAEDRDILRTAIDEIDPSIRCLEVDIGESALLLLSMNRQTPPDLIFLDINMPFMDGRECLKSIKTSKLFQDIKVVMCSTMFWPEEIDDFYRAGAFRFAPSRAISRNLRLRTCPCSRIFRNDRYYII